MAFSYILNFVLIISGVIIMLNSKKLSAKNPKPEKNTPKVFVLSGLILVVGGMASLIFVLAVSGWDVDLKELLIYLAVLGIVCSLACTVWSFMGKKFKAGIISLVALVLISGASIAFFSGTPDDVDRYGHDWADMIVIAEDAVKEQLKSPSTAEFSPKDETTFTIEDNVWEISGWVDAQNSFGATIRNTYTVKVTFDSETKYTINYCDID